MLLQVRCSLPPDRREALLARLPAMPLATIEERESVVWVLDADPDAVRVAIGNEQGHGAGMVGAAGFECQRPELVFRFPSRAAATAFKTWLCDSGEQDYFEWTRHPDADRSTRVVFGYHFPGGSEVVCTPYPGDDG